MDPALVHHDCVGLFKIEHMSDRKFCRERRNGHVRMTKDKIDSMFRHGVQQFTKEQLATDFCF